jgi:hypothetical protein
MLSRFSHKVELSRHQGRRLCDEYEAARIPERDEELTRSQPPARKTQDGARFAETYVQTA